jgi:ATP-dependent helicase Lhr and Lhr-like helicase
MTTFARFPARLQEAIVSRLGFSSLRAVQEEAGAAILDGKNAVVLAPTAGGKTEASIFPLLALMVDDPIGDSVGAIYIAPIKALLNNQEDRLGTYTEMVGLRRFVWHGDTKQSDKRKFTREPAELLMTTPESLEAMLLSPRVPTAALFRDLRFVVIDEVHAMAGTDRGAHLMSVLERIVRLASRDVQRVGLSATVGNPQHILTWLRGSSKREGCVVDPPKEPAKREIFVVHRPTLSELALEAAGRAAGKKSLFFCQSRALTEAVAEKMRDRDTEVFVHHGSVSHEERMAAEASFQRGSNVSIACTSTLELGIDVGDLDRVFQANAPSTVSSFLQRMGRTGRRAGRTANTTFFCEDAESVLQAIAIVELARQPWVEPVPPQARCWPVLVHQLLALTLQFGGVSRDGAWSHLTSVPDFSGVTRADYAVLVEHMLAHEYLFESGGLLSMGARAEKVYGRRNFLEMYAVFSTPVLFRVVTSAGKDIGSLDQAFVDRLVEQMSSFLLGGRPWTVDHINQEDKTVRVNPAPRGTKPSWGGYVPQFLGYELCQKVREVVAGDTSYPYIDHQARAVVDSWRDDLGPLLSRGALPLQVAPEAARWWTFAGGQINYTLRYALQIAQRWRVVADNFMLRIEGDGVSHDAIERAIAEMNDASFWEAPETEQQLLARLPPYRLSKFQEALPERFALEMVGRYLLDVGGARQFLEVGGRSRA